MTAETIDMAQLFEECGSIIWWRDGYLFDLRIRFTKWWMQKRSSSWTCGFATQVHHGDRVVVNRPELKYPGSLPGSSDQYRGWFNILITSGEPWCRTIQILSRRFKLGWKGERCLGSWKYHLLE